MKNKIIYNVTGCQGYLSITAEGPVTIDNSMLTSAEYKDPNLAKRIYIPEVSGSAPSWGKSIRRILDTNDTKTLHQYAMPRQIGATTFLRNLAMEKHIKDFKVLFVAGRRSSLPKDVPYDTISSYQELYHHLRGHAYDLVIVDGPIPKANQEHLLAVLAPLVANSNGKILWIDTIE